PQYRGAARISTSFCTRLDASPAAASLLPELPGEGGHGLPGPLPLRTRPLLLPHPGDRDRRALQLLALPAARRRPHVALHSGRRLHAARRPARPRQLPVEREGPEQLLL